MTEEEEFAKWKEKNGKSDEYMDGHIDEKDFDDYEDDQETVYDTEEDDVEDDKVIPEKSEDTDETSSMEEIKDLILNLSTKVDDLTQKVMDDAAEEPEEGGTLEDAGFGDDMGEDPFAEEGGEEAPSEGEGEGEGMEGEDPFAEEGGEEAPAEGEGEPAPEGEGSSSPEGEGEGEPKNEEPQDYAGEDSGEDENVETRKNEAWLRAKETGYLSLSSGTLISKLFNERYYDLDEVIVEVAKKKIRKLIDESKRRFVNKAKGNEE